MRSGHLKAKEHTLPDTTTTGTHNPDIFPTAETFNEFTYEILTDNGWSLFERLQFQLRIDIANEQLSKKKLNVYHADPINLTEAHKGTTV